jgi:hypothetical protein
MEFQLKTLGFILPAQEGKVRWYVIYHIMLVMHGVNIAYLVPMTIAAEVPKLCTEKKNTCMSV